VDRFKEMAEGMRQIAGSNVRARIYTDLSGPFHTVIQEVEVESLGEWERVRAEMFASPEFQQAQASGEPPFEGGQMEFYTIEAATGSRGGRQAQRPKRFTGRRLLTDLEAAWAPSSENHAVEFHLDAARDEQLFQQKSWS
jgi:hypothetical protein